MRRALLAIIVVAVVSTAAAIGAWSVWATPETPLSPRAAAERLVSDCQWQAAVDACDALLDEVPEDAEVVMWRGRGRLALGLFPDALDDFTRAIELRPNDAEARYYRAMVHERLGNRRLADAEYDAARQIDPHQDKLLAAMRAAQATADVHRAVQAATQRAERRSAKRTLVKADSVDEASVFREANRSARLPDDVVDGAKVSNSITSRDERPAIAELWANDDIAANEPNSPSTWSWRADAFYAANLTSRQPVRDNAYPGPAREVSSFARSNAETTIDPIDRRTDSARPTDAARSPTPGATAWEQFQQRQLPHRQRPASEALSSTRPTGTAPTMLEPNSEPSNSEYPQSAAVRAKKNPIRALTLFDSTPRSAVSPPSGLGPRPSASSAPFATPSWPRSQHDATNENSLSTAMIPMPEPAADMNAALAASRQGVLTMALFEIIASPPPQRDPSFATHTAPLPDWMAPPSFAAPN